MADQYETTNSARDVREGASLIQARDIGQVILPGGVEAGPEPERDPWVAAVSGSAVWRHVPEGRDTEPFRAAVIEFVRSLVPLRDEAQEKSGKDPWLDPGVPLRFHDRLNQLLGSPGQAEDLDLYPAEAALLVFTPFLFRVYELRRAVAALVDLDPGSLEEVEAPSPERRSFEAFVGEYRVLTERVRRREQDEAAVGWWLFHRWVLKAENSVGVDDLWGVAPELFHRLWKTDRIKQFLHGLRLGPGVCNPEHLERLRADEYVPVEGAQQLRERRLGLILALGFGMSLDAASLPETVLEHLAIPHPVDPVRLQDTVEGATWGSDRHLLTLSAECHHEAVIEGLREQVQRVDELLHGVHRSLRAHVADLPSRLSADLVEPAEGAFDGWAGFRIDERRARELLTGEQLYKNKDLAIRELYQNALDACRYRRARTRYLDRCNPLASFDYEGRIEFIQGVDDDGRAYVDCIDNGVGMGEAELRGVFSHAGSRFAEQSDFLQEKEKWEQLDPPVELYPNSRFGIGVLSYFMLADEIRVTTCRMHADGSLAPEVEASIHGPGHLFRITRTGLLNRTPGTTIRLYLKDDLVEGWSCVEALGDVLVVAEFHTTASDAKGTYLWPSGVARLDRVLSEPVPPWEDDDSWRYRPAGPGENRTIACDGLPGGAMVVWVDGAGQLLVDGLRVHYDQETRVLSAEDHDPIGHPLGPSAVRGAVVNLVGPHIRVDLSADRRQMLSDPSEQVLALLEASVEGLFGSKEEFFSEGWLAQVVQRSPVVGDVLVSGGMRYGVLHPEKDLEALPEHGYTYLDRLLFQKRTATRHRGEADRHPRSGRGSRSLGRRLFERFHLWRLLAVGPEASRDELIRLCPRLPRRDELRPALPSDLVLTLGADALSAPVLPALLKRARDLGFSPEEVVSRWRTLGLVEQRPDFPVEDLRGGESRSMIDLLSAGHIGLSGKADFLVLDAMSKELGMDIGGVVELLRSHGATVPESLVQEATGANASSVKEMVLALAGDFHSEEIKGRSRLGEVSRGFGYSPGMVMELLRDVGLGPLAERRVRNEIRTLCSDEGLPDAEVVAWAGELHGLVGREGFVYADVMVGIGRHETTLERVRRLELCGVDVGSRLRPESDRLGLLTIGHGLSWQQLPLGSVVKYPEIHAAARIFEVEPDVVVGALRDIGVPVVCERSSLEPDPGIARVLLPTGGWVDGYFPDTDTPLTLYDLVLGARRTGAPITQVSEWFRGLGYEVPDLVETLREAAPYIPRRG